MTNDILVFAEIRDGDFKKINGELVSAAKMLAEKTGGGVHIAVLGDGIDSAMEKAKGFDVQKVYAVKSPVLANYSSEGFAGGLEAVIREADPSVVLFGATAMGKDLYEYLDAQFVWMISVWTNATESWEEIKTCIFGGWAWFYCGCWPI